MNEMVKVVWTDGEPAVHLPAGFRFDTDDLRISRDGDRVVLQPADASGTVIDDDAVDDETGLTIRRLRALIQEGLDSGPAEEWDVEEIKRLAREQSGAQRG